MEYKNIAGNQSAEGVVNVSSFRLMVSLRLKNIEERMVAVLAGFGIFFGRFLLIRVSQVRDLYGLHSAPSGFDNILITDCFKFLFSLPSRIQSNFSAASSCIPGNT